MQTLNQNRRKIIGSAKRLFFITALSLILAGCGGIKAPELFNSPKKQEATDKIVTLTSEDTNLYQTAIKEILPNPKAVTFKSSKALQFENEPGIHICGYLNYLEKAGVQKEAPFYIELKQEGEKRVIHRGQVGSDPSKLSKVTFVCRRHKL